MPDESLWELRDIGMKAPIQDQASVSRDDVDYLCDKEYPFLQLVNSDAVFSTETKVEFTKVTINKKVWVIHDYGEAISVSAPHDVKPKGKADGDV